MNSCNPVTPDTTGNPGNTATAIDAGTATPRPSRQRKYILRPRTMVPLPRKALARVKKYLKLKTIASAAYSEMREIEGELMPPSGHGGLLQPDIVYQLPQPLRNGDKLVGSLAWEDQFKGHQATKPCIINRLSLTTWAGGPVDKIAPEPEN